MVLSDFILHSRANACWDYSGMDSIERCLDKKHFKNYPYKIKYVYNSRGFRDAEWPNSIDELRNAIWCIGDSFTVGLGAPLEHTWPYLLQQQTGRRCINVSLDGASNQWIARITQKLIEEINPDEIVIMWSYVHRRENKDASLSDEDRRIHEVDSTEIEDLINLKSCIMSASRPGITHTLIPGAYASHDYIDTIYNKVSSPSWPQKIRDRKIFENLPSYIVNELKYKFEIYDQIYKSIVQTEIVEECKKIYNLVEVLQLDYARDHHHFDKLTSQWLIEQIC